MLFLSLGRIPLTSILSSDLLAAPKERRSLEVAFCRRCCLVQLIDEGSSSPRFSAHPVSGALEGLVSKPQAVVLKPSLKSKAQAGK